MANRGGETGRTRRALDRALAMPVFTKHEAAIMATAYELAFPGGRAPAGGHPFRIHVSRLARDWGLSRENVARAITGLLADGVLEGTRDRLRLGLAIGRWRGRHALTPEQVAACSGPACGETIRDDQGCDEIVTGGVMIPSQSDPAPVTESSHPGRAPVTESSQGVTKSSRFGAAPVMKTSQGVTKTSQVQVPPSVPPLSPLASPLNPPLTPPRDSDSLSLSAGARADDPAPIGGTQQFRTEADLAYVRQAEALLASELTTSALAMELGRSQNLPGMREIPGWKWLVAARKILGPGINASARRSFRYLIGIAAKVGDDEWIEPVAHAPEPPAAPDPAGARNGIPSPAAAELPPTKAELRRRKGDALFARVLDKMGED